MPSPTDDCYLRRMRPADLERVEAIERQAFSDPWSIGSFRKELAQPHCTSPLVLARGDEAAGQGGEQLAGYMILWCLVDELHIANVAVHCELRGQGWGKKLIEAAFYLGQRWEMPHYLLEVRRSNTVARGLYDKLGFLPLSVRRNYYRSPVEDALVLYHPRPPKLSRPPLPILEDALPRPGS